MKRQSTHKPGSGHVPKETKKGSYKNLVRCTAVCVMVHSKEGLGRTRHLCRDAARHMKPEQRKRALFLFKQDDVFL